MSSPRDGDPLVRTQELTRVFGAEERVTALAGLSICVRRGEFVAVQGPSGSGKSTLLHLLAGLDGPTSGSVWIDGVDLAALSDDERCRLRRRRIGIVLPVVELVPTLTAWENVAIGLLLDGGRLGSGRGRAHQLLGDVGLGHRAATRAARLSAGEAQRVSLARALFGDPDLLLADEPTSSLDSVRSEEVVAMLRSLADEGRTILMATHDTRAAAYADRSIRLVDGRIQSRPATAT